MADEILLFDQHINKIHLLFRIGGINLKWRELSTLQLIKSRIVYIINFLWLNTDLAGGIYWFIDGVKTGEDFLGLTYIAPCITFSTLGDMKSLMLVANEELVQKLIEILRNLEKKERKREYSKEKADIIQTESGFLNNVVNVIFWLYVCCVCSFATIPIVIIMVKYVKTSELDLLLPFLILYPFDPFQIKVWPFVYIHQILSEIVVCNFFLMADLFFFTCCTHIRIQFKLLRHSICNIFPNHKNGNWMFRDDEEFKAKFKEIINWHQDLIESVEILDVIFNKSTLLNFACSSLVICLTGFNVTMVGDVAFVIVFMSFLFMSLFQVFFLCFFADYVMAASMEISDAIYESKWYMAESRVGKKLLLMQIRGQTPCRLTAYRYADVNLNLFMGVMSSAWSYFALLQTIYGN